MEPWRDFCIRMLLKLGPAVLVVLSFVAILVGIILHAISIDEVQFKNPPAKHFDTSVIIDHQFKDLVWFLQITDLHISHTAPAREKDLREFCDTYVDIIKPDAVLVTGDITDGRKPNTTFDSGPQLSEWLAYSRAVTDSGVLNRTNWLDIRGNHDNFNVMRPEDSNILYRQYSIRGKEHSRNYEVTIQSKDGKNYTFIAVDEVQTPGLKIPLNFIGIVKDQDLKELKRFKDLAEERNSQYKVWFAHYPTSSIASPNEGLRNIIDGPYLCGHFHTIGNLVLKMHATQQPGFAEVELGDWKYNRRLRLAAIDHQLFSLVDVPFRQFPIALMTNPKNAEFSMPKYEPAGRILNSTHIRVIAFSNVSISNVKLNIDGQLIGDMEHSSGPLYTIKWNPRDYKSGLHHVAIRVIDSEGKDITYKQTFSMDGSKEEFTLGARILLRAYFKSYVMAIFFFITSVCALPLALLRYLVYRHDERSLKRHYKGTFLFNLHLLSKVNQLFWPLIIIPTWVAIGPHFIGHLLDEAIGVCFVWGVLIESTFIHTGITYNIGSIFLLLVHIPIVVLLTYRVSNSNTSNNSSPVITCKSITFLFIIVLQLWMGYLLYSAYGFLSWLTSFPFTWCILIYIYCWHKSGKLTMADFDGFNRGHDHGEDQQALTGQRVRDDKSSSSDHSTC